MSVEPQRFGSAREWLEQGRLATYPLAFRTAGAQGVLVSEAWRTGGVLSYPALNDLVLIVGRPCAKSRTDPGRRHAAIDVAPEAVHLLVQGSPGTIRFGSSRVIRALVLPHAAVRSALAEAGREAADFGWLQDGPFHDPFLLGVVERLWEAGGEGSPEHGLFADSAAPMLVARLLQLAAQAPPQARGGLSPSQLRRVREYCEANLAADLTLGDLAAIADLSPYHFARAFRRTIGRSPHVWLTELRMQRARELMTVRPPMPLIDVALCVGYSSQTAFGAAFRRVVGAAPGEWRRQQEP
jgi:AraC family transcriptional regulator